MAGILLSHLFPFFINTNCQLPNGGGGVVWRFAKSAHEFESVSPSWPAYDFYPLVPVAHVAGRARCCSMTLGWERASLSKGPGVGRRAFNAGWRHA